MPRRARPVVEATSVPLAVVLPPVVAAFAPLPDPRVERTKRHALLDIVAITLCGVVAGAETWVDIAEFGRAREAWFRTFLALSHGMPSHAQRDLVTVDGATCSRRWRCAVPHAAPARCNAAGARRLSRVELATATCRTSYSR